MPCFISADVGTFVVADAEYSRSRSNIQPYLVRLADRSGSNTRARKAVQSTSLPTPQACAFPELAKKTSYIYLGAYYDNALVVPRFDPNMGKHIIAVPFKGDKKITVINAKESTGRFVRALIEDEAPSTKLLAYDTYPTMNEIVEQWSKANGKKAVLVPITIGILRHKSGLTDEHLDAFAAFTEHGYVEGVEGATEPDRLKHGGK